MRSISSIYSKLRFSFFIIALPFFFGCSKILVPHGSDTAFSVSGVVHLAPATGTVVSFFACSEAGEKQYLLAQATTGPNGYTTNIANYTGYVLVETSGGIYIDEATGLEMEAPALSTLFFLDRSSIVPITPMTTLMKELAMWHLNTSSSLEEARTRAVTKVAGFFGVEPQDLEIIPTPPRAMASNGAEATRAALGLTAFSYLSNYLKNEDSEVGLAVVIHTIIDDLHDDGEFNGSGGDPIVAQKVLSNWKPQMESGREEARKNGALVFSGLSAQFFQELSRTAINIDVIDSTTTNAIGTTNYDSTTTNFIGTTNYDSTITNDIGTTSYDSTITNDIGTTNLNSSTTIQTDGLLSHPETVLLVHADDVNGSINFNDSSQKRNTFASYGNPSISTSQSKFGGGSLAFDGSSFLKIPDADWFNLASGSYTIDLWFYPAALDQNYQTLTSKSVYYAGYAWSILVNSDGLALRDNSGLTETAAQVNQNEWNHVALVSTGSSTDLFLNGHKVLTKNSPMNNVSGYITLGAADVWPPENFFVGNMDEVRFTLGKALFSDDFSPPQVPYRVFEGCDVDGNLSDVSDDFFTGYCKDTYYAKGTPLPGLDENGNGQVSGAKEICRVYSNYSGIGNSQGPGAWGTIEDSLPEFVALPAKVRITDLGSDDGIIFNGEVLTYYSAGGPFERTLTNRKFTLSANNGGGPTGYNAKICYTPSGFFKNGQLFSGVEDKVCYKDGSNTNEFDVNGTGFCSGDNNKYFFYGQLFSGVSNNVCYNQGSSTTELDENGTGFCSGVNNKYFYFGQLFSGVSNNVCYNLGSNTNEFDLNGTGFCSGDNNKYFYLGTLANGKIEEKTYLNGVLIPECSSDCYDGAQDLVIGSLRVGPEGSFLELAYANGTNGFKIWREKDGNRVLNSTGLNSNGWQKNLTRAGTSFDGYLTSSSVIEKIQGRVCPPNVFLDYDNMTATNRCLFYTLKLSAQSFLQQSPNPPWNGPSGSVEGEDWLGNWTSLNTGRGSQSSYYEGNIKTCADLGARLALMYETQMNKPSSYLPTGDGIDPIWAGSTNGVPDDMPSTGFWLWTASASTRSYNTLWLWIGTTPENINNTTSYSSHVRCVLPSH